MIRVKYNRAKIVQYAYDSYEKKKLSECFNKLKADREADYPSVALWTLIERFFASLDNCKPIRYRLLCNEYIIADGVDYVVELKSNSNYIYVSLDKATQYHTGKSFIREGRKNEKWYIRWLYKAIRKQNKFKRTE